LIKSESESWENETKACKLKVRNRINVFIV
jgi:hypothetical protein